MARTNARNASRPDTGMGTAIWLVVGALVLTVLVGGGLAISGGRQAADPAPAANTTAAAGVPAIQAKANELPPPPGWKPPADAGK